MQPQEDGKHRTRKHRAAFLDVANGHCVGVFCTRNKTHVDRFLLGFCPVRRARLHSYRFVYMRPAKRDVTTIPAQTLPQKVFGLAAIVVMV